MAGSEDDHFEVLVGLHQTLSDIWTDVDSSIDDFPSWEGDRQDDVGVLRQIIAAMDQRFVEIKHQRLQVGVSRFLRQVDQLVFDLLWVCRRKAVYKLHCLECLEEVFSISLFRLTFYFLLSQLSF